MLNSVLIAFFTASISLSTAPTKVFSSRMLYLFTLEDLAISKLMDSLGSNIELNLCIDKRFKKAGVKSLIEAKMLDR